MDLSPQLVRTVAFKTVRKGYDPDEVEAFKDQVAGTIEAAQNQSAAMEARARAAVAKLQELSSQPPSAAPSSEPAALASDDADTISRTLLLAQRTADSTVAEAKAEAAAIASSARVEAANVIDSARTMSARLLDEARAEARKGAEAERLRAENEVQALLARREFLVADVEQLEQHLGAQRERLREAAVALHDLVERVPGGLGEMRRPLLSASAEPSVDSEPQVETRSLETLLAEVAPPAVPEFVEPAPAPAPAPVVEPETPAGRAADPDDVWRLLDEPSGQQSMLDEDDTAEVPDAPIRNSDPFGIADEEQ